MTQSSETIDPQNQDPNASSMPMPTGAPLKEWRGIPVMPAASAGEGDDSGYSYVVKSSPADMKNYYQETLTSLGWNILADSLDDTGAVLLIGMQDENMLTVTGTPMPEGVMYVFLVK